MHCNFACPWRGAESGQRQKSHRGVVLAKSTRFPCMVKASINIPGEMAHTGLEWRPRASQSMWQIVWRREVEEQRTRLQLRRQVSTHLTRFPLQDSAVPTQLGKTATDQALLKLQLWGQRNVVMMSLNPEQRSILWVISSSEEGLIWDFLQKPRAVASMASVQNHLKWSTLSFILRLVFWELGGSP